nr:glycosyltransferase [Victivallales bacterium]
MKVLFIADSSCVHTRRRLEILKDTPGLELCLLTDSESRINGIEQYKLKSKIKIPGLRFISKFFFIRDIISEVSPNLVHVISAHPLNLLVSFTGFKPLVISCWGGDVLRAQGARKNLIYDYIFRHAMRNASKILCVSQEIWQEVDAVSPGKSILQAFGVDLRIFFKRQNLLEIKRKNSIPADHKVIFSPRGLGRIYNINRILSSFARLENQAKDYVLILNSTLRAEGDEERLSEIKSLVEKLKIGNSVLFK